MTTTLQTTERMAANRVNAPATIERGTLALAAVFVLALVLRVMQLDSVPMTAVEAPDALAALRAVIPATPGQPLVASSAAVFLAQAAGFSLLGSGALAARLVTALAGALLVLAPLLFRKQLGVGWSFAFCLALAVSPALLMASRGSSGEIWALGLAVLAMAAFLRWRDTRQPGWAIGASAAGTGLVLLTGWNGPVLALILLGAAVWSAVWSRRSDRFAFEPQAEDGTPWTAGFPWLGALLISGLAVAVAATAFMLHPAGLSSVAAAVGGFVSHFGPLSGAASALVNSLFYETAAWGLGIASVIYLAQRGLIGPAERFLIVWLIMGTAASLLFAAGPAQALWTTVPLAGLVGRLLVDALALSNRPGNWAPYYGRFVSALAGLGLLFIFTLAFQAFARALAQAPLGDIASAPVDPASVILMVVMALFAGVVMVLGATLWNTRTVVSGAALALMLFGGLASLGAGWHASAFNAADPAEPWHAEATQNSTTALSSALVELQNRQSRGFPSMPIAVLAAQDSVLAWLVRDYPNATFVTAAREAAGVGVFLSNTYTPPELNGAYVGQDFTITAAWTYRVLRLNEIPAWWAQRLVEPGVRASTLVTPAVLWVRQDVYDGVDTAGQG